MIDDMGRKLPRYAYAERNRKGEVYRYVFRRSKKHERIPLPWFGSPEFDAEYAKALQGTQAPQKPQRGVASLEWLIARYRTSKAYLDLSRATRKQRNNIFRHVVDSAGGARYRDISKKHIIDGLDRRADTPAQARNFLQAMRGLFQWAVSAQFVTEDPTASIKTPKRPKTQGFPIWTQADVDAYRARWPLGTRERVWMEVLIATGARRGDAVVIGRQHLSDGLLTIDTQKEGVRAYVPVLPSLLEAIEAGGAGDMVFIVGEKGLPLVKESFGNMFRAACNKAGVRKSAHGLRKYAATVYAEIGLTEAQLETIFGWVRGSGMAAHYSKDAERKRMAKEAAEKIRNTHAPALATISPAQKKV